MPDQAMSSAEATTGTTLGTAPPRRLALPVIVTCQLMLMIDTTVMNVALPQIQADLHFSRTGLAWVLNAYTLVFGGLLLLGGRTGDLFGRRRMFTAGITLFTLASLAGGLAQSTGMLLAARVAQGLGAAAAGPNTLALLVTAFSGQRERVRALAIFSGMASAGLSIGLVLGGLVNEWLSWRWVLFINIPFGVAIVALTRRHVPEGERHPGRLDLPGAAIATAGVASTVYGLLRAAGTGWHDTTAIAAIAAGAVLVAGFVVRERYAAEPLFPLRLLADGNRARGYLNFFLAPMVGMSMFFFLTQYLQDVRGYGPLRTGLAFVPLAGAMFGVTRLISRLLTRFGPRLLAITGSTTMLIALAALTRLSVTSGYAVSLLGPMLLMGIGMGLGFSPLNVLIMSTVPPRDAGVAGGMLQTMQQVGGTLGLAILVTVFGVAASHAAAGGADGPHALVTGMTHAFTGGCVIAALTVLIAATFRRPPAEAA